jgi:hypothetical protein
MIVFANARVVTRRRVLEPGWVCIADERIVGVGTGGPPTRSDEVPDLMDALHGTLP